MAQQIIARFVRGRVFYQVSDVLFPTLAQAVRAWNATRRHQLNIAEPLDDLIVRRAAALVEMRGAGVACDSRG